MGLGDTLANVAESWFLNIGHCPRADRALTFSGSG